LTAASYANPHFPELTKQLRSAFDPEQEDRPYRELSRLFQEDVPATFLYPDVLTTVATGRIRGLNDSPYRGDLNWCMDDLSVEGKS
jgi:ABC-type transport system substrate-binding protein